MPKFTPRLRKQKHRRQEDAAPVDTNVSELAPVSKDEKEAKRQKLRDELRDQHTNVSSKKQKRLDKYIVCAISKSIKSRQLTLHLGKQTQERRERRTPQETRPSQSRYFCIQKLQGIGTAEATGR